MFEQKVRQPCIGQLFTIRKPQYSLCWNRDPNFNLNWTSRSNFLSCFSPLIASSFYSSQNIPICQMVNHRLWACHIFFHYISFSNDSNLNIIEFRVNYLNKKDTLSISEDSLFTNKTLPYFIILYLHNLITFDPKILD